MKPIKGYEDYLINENGTKIYSTKTKKYLKIWYSEHQRKTRTYIAPRVTFCICGKQRHYRISHLVYSTYNGDLKPGFQVDHKDNNPLNNHYSNLQLLTPSENMKKRFIDTPTLKVGRKMKPFFCVETGEIFDSLVECAQTYNLIVSGIWGVLHR